MKKNILITGATGPLGQTLAKELSLAGYKLLLHYHRDKKTAEQLAKKFKAKLLKANLENPQEVAEMFKKIKHLDGLINGVGSFIYKKLKNTKTEELEKIIANNLLTSWYCIKEALSKMRRQKFGRIISFGSVGCDQITVRPQTTPYYIAKTGLLMLTKTLAREENKNNITINLISPGILPHGLKPQKNIPNIKFDDVAQAVLFLLSKEAGAISGANLDISRGWRPE